MSETTTPLRAVEAVIDLDALRENVRILVEIAAPSEVMLAVKADAYGHGQIEIAKAGLEAGATSLAVLEIPAGLALRRAGIEAPLFAWLHGPESDFHAGIEAGIELGISAIWQLEAIARAGASRPAILHLKLDTGLSRNGATIEQWPALLDAALELEKAGVVRIRAAWSHFADASDTDNLEALALFRRGIEIAENKGIRFEVLHIAASGAGIDLPETRLDLVRFGIAAYGLSPFDDRSGADLGLKPVMTLRAPVVELFPGSGLARVAGGFADGIASKAFGRATVQLAGERRTVRAIEVDSLIVETDDADIDLGDIATIFGPGSAGEPTAEDWGAWAETIGDEIVTHLSPRVSRRYLG